MTVGAAATIRCSLACHSPSGCLLQVSFSRGNVLTLHNLELNLAPLLGGAAALVHVRRAFARRLSITIPWTALTTQPIQAGAAALPAAAALRRGPSCCAGAAGGTMLPCRLPPGAGGPGHRRAGTVGGTSPVPRPHTRPIRLSAGRRRLRARPCRSGRTSSSGSVGGRRRGLVWEHAAVNCASRRAEHDWWVPCQEPPQRLNPSFLCRPALLPTTAQPGGAALPARSRFSQ